MLRLLQQTPFRLFSTTPPADAPPSSPPPSSAPASSKPTEYLLFPTAYPVSPFYFYSTRINKHLYEFMLKHKIRYVAAFPIRPGVYRRSFYPMSIDHLETERTRPFIQLV